MKKFRLYYDTEKEIKWLNELSDQGWKLTGFFLGVYTFEPCEKGRYRYQVDTATSFGRVSKDYREFMEEAGIEIVQVWGPWVILCRDAAEGKFELFTDYESRLKYQQKMLMIFKICTIIELVCFFMELFSAADGHRAAMVFCVIIGAILVVFGRTVMTIKQRIYRLKMEAGELSEQEVKKRNPHFMLLPGYLLYLCSIFIHNDASDLMQGVKDVMLVAACICMLIGIFLTFSRRGEK